MSTHQISKKDSQNQEVDQSSQHAGGFKTQEVHRKTEGSAGLNLNIGGLLGGAFSSSSKKSTRQNKDGSSETVEEKSDRGAANAAAHGSGQAYAKGSAEEYGAKSEGRAIGQEKKQVKAGKEEEVNHLGIEA